MTFVTDADAEDGGGACCISLDMCCRFPFTRTTLALHPAFAFHAVADTVFESSENEFGFGFRFVDVFKPRFQRAIFSRYF
jgi:hypothetical protein